MAYHENDASPWPDAEGNFGAVRGSNPGEELKYFFWIRRVGNTGAVTHPLSFRKIAELRFDGPFRWRWRQNLQWHDSFSHAAL